MGAADKTTFIERRSQKRQRVGKYLLRLDPGSGREPVTCSVWDISERGARLTLSEIIDLPKVVHILIGNLRKPAAVAWRIDDQIGVEFFPEER
jgi:hypothetical protein